MFCSLTNEKITDVLEMDINFIFYTASYEILRLKEEQKAIKKIQKANK
jgi:hypothetical protein